MRISSIILATLIAFAGFGAANEAAAGLKNCKPVKNCRTGDKPCFVVAPQDDFAVAFVGEDVEDNPLRPKAAIRLRMCTGADDVCESGSNNQRFNWFVVNQIVGDIVLGGQLSTVTGILDTGPYTEIGPHTFFGGTCLNGDEPCKIAWQYCELELPFTSGSGGGGGLKTPREIVRHLNNRKGYYVRENSLFAR